MKQQETVAAIDLIDVMDHIRRVPLTAQNSERRALALVRQAQHRVAALNDCEPM